MSSIFENLEREAPERATWERKEVTGYFGPCSRCHTALASDTNRQPMTPVVVWVCYVGVTGRRRHYCAACGPMERGDN